MTRLHPGFSAVAKEIQSKGGYTANAARAILAARTRAASAKARRSNPRLNRVKG